MHWHWYVGTLSSTELLLIEKFAKEDYFGKKECMVFLTSSFEAFMDGALFKIKK